MKTILALSLLLLTYTAQAFYEPSIGRWINRDPIGERGGINLYSFVENNPITWVDLFGLDATVQQDGNKVTITIPIQYQGPGATTDVTTKFNSGIETHWSGKIGKYDVTTKVTMPDPNDQQINTIQVPEGDGRATCNKVGGNKGDWPAMRPSYVAAHEAGHLMGLPDQYYEGTGKPKEGYENNIMATPGAPPSENDITKVIEINKPKKP